MEFIGEPNVGRGVVELRFDMPTEGEVIPGILWTPEGASGTRPLVLIGHGGSQHKRAPNVLAIARRFVRHLGFAAAAIDGPMHGDRAPQDAGEMDLASVRNRFGGRSPEEVREMFRNARAEWSQTLTALQDLDEVGRGPTGYWGLSMGTVIGLAFVASEPRIRCAVLGLMGLGDDARSKAAATIDVPVMFMVQSEDELVPREQAFALFDALATKDKTMHVNPGIHVAVPAFEVQAWEGFFQRHLGGAA